MHLTVHLMCSALHMWAYHSMDRHRQQALETHRGTHSQWSTHDFPLKQRSLLLQAQGHRGRHRRQRAHTRGGGHLCHCPHLAQSVSKLHLRDTMGCVAGMPDYVRLQR
jgi:hypothetical protein